MRSSALFSDDRKYRHSLLRVWSDDETRILGCFIGKNPSDANEEDNDPTMVKEIGFGRRWAWRGLLKENLYDIIATDSADLVRISDSLCVSPLGLVAAVIERIKAHGCEMVICAWGTHSNRYLAESIRQRGDHMRRALVAAGLQPYYLKKNKDRTPAHTLFLSPLLKPIPWNDLELRSGQRLAVSE